MADYSREGAQPRNISRPPLIALVPVQVANEGTLLGQAHIQHVQMDHDRGEYHLVVRMPDTEDRVQEFVDFFKKFDTTAIHINAIGSNTPKEESFNGS